MIIKKIITLLLLLIAYNLFSQNKNNLLIKNIKIISAENGNVSKNINIYIKDGVIKQIEKDKNKIKSSSSDLIIDGTGKFLMSGYFDSYSLMPSKSNPIKYDAYFLLNLINGITTQIVMKYDENNEKYRDSIDNNKYLGTNLFLCQPAISEFKGYEKMSKSFDDYKLKGYNHIKYVEGLTVSQFDSISTILKSKNIHFFGRIHAKGLSENIKVGMKNIYHIKEFDVALEKDSHSVYKLIPLLCKNGIFITPTMFFHYYEWDQFSKDELYAFPELTFVPKYLKDFWIKEFNEYDRIFIQAKNEQYITERNNFKRRLENYNLMLRKIEKCNGKFLVGSDEIPFNVPGYGFHREIQLFKNAKLSNKAILMAVTSNAAESIGENKRMGFVKAGMMADLVILNSNPLDDVANLKDINAVIKSGNYNSIIVLKELLNKSIANDSK